MPKAFQRPACLAAAKTKEAHWEEDMTLDVSTALAGSYACLRQRPSGHSAIFDFAAACCWPNLLERTGVFGAASSSAGIGAAKPMSLPV
tara:strand:+ start:4170 stop:4436 length:267 start_codon:yes stop_codon:yes gene_type:complete